MSKRRPQGQPPVVYVEWHDARNVTSSWKDREEVLDDAKKLAHEVVTTAGFLLAQTKQYVVVAASHAPNDDVGNVLLIMRSNIVVLRIVKRQRGGKWK